MWRRYTPYTRRFLEPMIRTSHSPPSGRAIGRDTLRRPASDRMLTNRTTSAGGGSVPKGLSISSRIRSLPSQKARSEEHTSELQSHSDIVCRLLLEKKKKRKDDG